MKWIRFCFLNVGRNKRRNSLNILAIALNLAIIIFYVALFRGYFSRIVDRIIDFQTGHIQIHHQDYEAEAGLLPLDLSMINSKQIQDDILSMEGIDAVGRRIEFKAQLSNGNDSLGVVGMAIEPEIETKIGVIHSHIKLGSYLNATDSGVQIGRAHV